MRAKMKATLIVPSARPRVAPVGPRLSLLSRRFEHERFSLRQGEARAARQDVNSDVMKFQPFVLL
jgi:hypothetical protein